MRHQHRSALMHTGTLTSPIFNFNIEREHCLNPSCTVTMSVCDTRRRGNCKKASVGLQCEVGLRCRTFYVLCGSVLSVWNEVELVLTPVSGTNVKVQIVRLRTEDGQRIVGKLQGHCGEGPIVLKLNGTTQQGFYSGIGGLNLTERLLCIQIIFHLVQ